MQPTHKLEPQPKPSVDEVGGDELVKSIGIPPRPTIVAELQLEMGKEDPDLDRVASLVSSDVAITAAVLRLVNSPAYGLSRRAETMQQALMMLGLKQVGVLVTGLLLRKALNTEGPQLTRFWDVSAKRAFAMSKLARQLRGVEVDIAQCFGLMCDVGIPLLMQRFPTYADTLKAANQETEQAFTEVERAVHATDHTLIGAIMSRSWGMSQTVCMAIRRHHDYTVFRDPTVPDAVARLIALGLIAEAAIQRFSRMNSSTEWQKGGESALGALLLADTDFEDWIDVLMDDFGKGLA